MSQVQRLALTESGILVPKSIVSWVLQNPFQIHYKQIKPVPFQGNSQRFLILRSLYTQKILSVLEQGMRVINIDETWLPCLDFSRRRWCIKGGNNSKGIRSLNPLISMIVGLSSSGEVYCSAT